MGAAPDDHLTAGPHCRMVVSGMGALVVLVAVQLSVLGLYLLPVFQTAHCRCFRPRRSFRCQSTPPCDCGRAASGLVVLVAVQMIGAEIVFHPVLERPALPNAPTIVSLPSTLRCEPIRQRACWW